MSTANLAFYIWSVYGAFGFALGGLLLFCFLQMHRLEKAKAQK